MKHRAYKFRFYPPMNKLNCLLKRSAVCGLSIITFCVGVPMSITKAKQKIGYIQANAKLTELKKQPEFAF